MIGQSSFAGRFMVRIICALALVLIGFAHKAPSAEHHSIPASEVAHYALPDGTVPELCLSSGNGKTEQDGHDFGPGCEACRLTAAVILPSPSGMAGKPVFREIPDILPFRAEAHYRQIFCPNAPPRGPPSGLPV